MTMMRDHKVFEVEITFAQEIREPIPLSGETRKVGEQRGKKTLWVVAKNWETVKAYILVDRKFVYKECDILGFSLHDIDAVILQLPT